MRAHFHPIVYEVRFYEDGSKNVEECFKDKEDWEGGCVVQVTGNAAFVSMLQAKFDRRMFVELKRKIFDLGVDQVYWESNGCIQIVRKEVR